MSIRLNPDRSTLSTGSFAYFLYRGLTSAIHFAAPMLIVRREHSLSGEMLIGNSTPALGSCSRAAAHHRYAMPPDCSDNDEDNPYGQRYADPYGVRRGKTLWRAPRPLFGSGRTLIPFAER